MKNSLIFIFIILIGCTKDNVKDQQKKNPADFSLATELEFLSSIDLLPSYRTGTTVAQVSSYDTTGGNNDGFSGLYSFIRKEGNRLLIADLKGPGVIHRIWTPTPSEDTLKFYFDGEPTPRLSIRFIDLFASGKFPFISPLCGNEVGGYYSYVPITFKSACKIYYCGPTIMFHQIQFRQFPDTADVESFPVEWPEKEKALLMNAAETWKMDKEAIKNKIKNDHREIEATEGSFTLNPGENHEIFYSSKGGRIVKFEIGSAEAFAGNEKDIIIEARWDGEESLAINCPLPDFFGYAFGKPSMRSMLAGSDDHMNYSFIPMPFDTKAWIRLVYLKRDGEQEPLEITSSIWHTTQSRNENHEGKLYAAWKRENPVRDGESHIFLNETGHGHLIGTILQAQGLKAGMTQFFEGDDSTVVDGIMRLHGTGSEDYFNGGWYALPDRWDRAFSLPVHGSLDYSIPFAKTGGFRFYIGDKISFDQNIFHSIEHGPVGNHYPADYTSLTFYYGEKGPENISLPDVANTILYMPDTFVLTPDLLKITPGLFTNVEYPDWGLAVFSCKQKGIIRISLDELPLGRYQVFMTYFNQPAGARFSLWQRQQQRSEIFSAKAEKETVVVDQHLGEIYLDDFYTTISFSMEPSTPPTYLKVRSFKFIRISATKAQEH